MVENKTDKTVFMAADRTGDANPGEPERSTVGIAEAPGFLRHVGFSGGSFFDLSRLKTLLVSLSRSGSCFGHNESRY